MNCLLWAEAAGRAYIRVGKWVTTSSGTVRTPSRPLDGEGRELKHKCHLTILSFHFRVMWYVAGTVREYKNSFVLQWLAFCKSLSLVVSTAFVSLPPHHCSCMPAVRVRVGGMRKSWLFFWGGEGGYFDCLYLSGVNFQALSSFWACSSLSLVCSSSAFILRKNKLMAGSTMDDRSWAALGCWTCLRYWIWVCRIKQTGVTDR